MLGFATLPRANQISATVYPYHHLLHSHERNNSRRVPVAVPDNPNKRSTSNVPSARCGERTTQIVGDLGEAGGRGGGGGGGLARRGGGGKCRTRVALFSAVLGGSPFAALAVERQHGGEGIALLEPEPEAQRQVVAGEARIGQPPHLGHKGLVCHLSEGAGEHVSTPGHVSLSGRGVRLRYSDPGRSLHCRGGRAWPAAPVPFRAAGRGRRTE